jgi:Holliday junction resolvase RusA-like endonuclease
MELTIPFEPVAKGRGRAAIVRGHAMIYTPKKTSDAQQYIRQWLDNHGVEPVRDAALAVDVIFYRSRPKHLKKSQLLPTQKPDLDNYEKLVFDALEKFAYENDSQITTKISRKRFGSPPRIELSLYLDPGGGTPALGDRKTVNGISFLYVKAGSDINVQ